MASAGDHDEGPKVQSGESFADAVARLPGGSAFLRMQRVRPYPDVYIGGTMSTKRVGPLTNVGITHMLSLNGETPMWAAFSAGTVKVKVVEIDDEPDEPMLGHLEDCHAFIDAARESGGAVLVFCTAGISRSATVVTSYLMRREGIGFHEALHRLKQDRPWVRPNAGFERQLLEYEQRLRQDGVLRGDDGDEGGAAAGCLAAPADTAASDGDVAAQGISGEKAATACELCMLQRKTRWLDVSDPRFAIIECDACDMPMAVWRTHRMDVPPAGLRDMQRALEAVADAELGADAYYVDTIQRTISDHLHWHARPLTPAMRLILTAEPAAAVPVLRAKRAKL